MKMLVRLFSILTVVSLIGSIVGLHDEPARSQSGTTWVKSLPMIQKNSPPPSTLFGADATPVTILGGIQQMRNANMYWTKAGDVLWSEVEAVPGTYDWSALLELENSLVLVQSLDMQPIVNVRSTPDWAQDVPGYFCGRIKPTELVAFGNFMHELVLRYSQPPYNVKYWEIWNEPDVAPTQGFQTGGIGCWGDIGDEYFGGGYYAEMLKTIYPRIKEADPSAQVIAGNLLLDCDPNNPPPGKTCHESRFLEGMLRHNDQNDGANYFDLLNFHGYEYAFYDMNLDPQDPWNEKLGIYGNPNWSSSWDRESTVLGVKAAFIIQQFLTLSIPPKPLFVTELAILCGSFSAPPGTPPCDSIPTSKFELTKAYYLTRSYVDTFYHNIQGVLWYRALGWRNSNLLNSDLSPRPAYYALRTARKALANSTIPSAIHTYPGVFGYVFDRGDRLVWVIWSLDGLPHPVDLGGVPLSSYDALGVTMNITSTLTVDVKPIYLEWPR